MRIDAASLPLLVAGLRHRFEPGQPPVVELARLAIGPGATVALTGPSGSGKTTLAYLLTGIERVREGSVRWGGTDLAALGEGERDAWRRRHVGLVFQDFHLVPGLSIRDNVLVSCWFDAWRAPPALVERAGALLDRCGVPTAGRRVTDLSRGERQRVALARALLRRPPLVIVDEPTASLDAASGGRVIELLVQGVREVGATLLAVTHDPDLIAAMGTVYHLEHGRLDRVR